MVDVVPMGLYDTLTEILNGFGLKLSALESRIAKLEDSIGVVLSDEDKAAINAVSDLIKKLIV